MWNELQHQRRCNLKEQWMKLLRISSQAAALQLGIAGSVAHAQATPANAAACPTESRPTMNFPHPAGRAAMAPPQMVFSSTVKPSDLSTSTLMKPDPKDQIHCGRTELRSVHDVVFSKPVLADGDTKLLKMDVLSPASPARRPLVIYLTGGGFMVAPKESGLNLRTFIAESGFVVASIQYRTIADRATYADSLADVKSAILHACVKHYSRCDWSVSLTV
jgi:acetyl esterase/lipase